MRPAPQETFEPGAARGEAILFYDGVCGLCNRLVRFLLKRDIAGRLRYAPLQSGFAAGVLHRHGEDPAHRDTVFLLTGHGASSERLLSRSEAVLVALQLLGKGWRALAGVLRLAPRPWRDAVYDRVARVRYRIFGKADRCAMPSPQNADRFIEPGGGRA